MRTDLLARIFAPAQNAAAIQEDAAQLVQRVRAYTAAPLPVVDEDDDPTAPDLDLDEEVGEEGGYDEEEEEDDEDDEEDDEEDDDED